MKSTSLYLSLLSLAGLLPFAGCRPSQSDQALDPSTVAKAVQRPEPSPPLPQDRTTAPSSDTQQSDAPEEIPSSDSTRFSNTTSPAGEANLPQVPQSGNILKEGVVKDPVEAIRPVIDDPSENWIDWKKLPLEIWELSFLGQRPVGTSSRTYQKSRGLEGDVIRVEMNSISRVSIAGKISLQRLQLITQELPNGQILRLDGSLQAGDVNNRFSGIVSDDQLRIDMNSGSRPLRTSLTWLDDFRGPFAVEQSLVRRPMSQKEIRLVKNFDPMIGRLVEAELEYKGSARSPTMLKGSIELQEVSVTQRDGDQSVKSTLWTDLSGEPMKSFFPDLDIRVFRVTEKESIDFARQSEWLVASVPILDIGSSEKGTSPLEKQMSRAEAVSFRVVHNKEDPFVSLSRKTNQSIKSLDARSGQVTFHRTPEGVLLEGIETEDGPYKEWIVATDWVDFKSNRWQAFRKTIATPALREGQNERAKVIAMRDALRGAIKPWKGEQQIRTIETLLTDLSCNSIEHALLLAHLLRDHGIPTRLALGYKVEENDEKLIGVLDCWLEAHDGTHWFAIDESEEEGDIWAGRIKVRESDFGGSELYDELRSVAAWAQGAKIEMLP
ncbi:transglutaminase domain-containing protein [Pirellulaceae bacterium SH467]